MDRHRVSESFAPPATEDSGANHLSIDGDSESLLRSYEETLARERQLRKSAEEELQAEMQSIARFHELNTRLFAKTELDPLLDEVLDATIAIQSADFGCVQLYDSLTRSLHIVTQRGFNEDFLEHFRDCRDESTICGRALLRGERVVVEDVLEDPACAPHLGTSASAGYRAAQCTPLFTHKHEPLGVLSTLFRQPHRPSERELRFTDLYAHRAAVLIERQQTEDALRRHEAFLMQAQKLSHTGSWSLNIATGNLWWSDEHFRIAGLDPKTNNPTYPTALQVVHPEDRAFVQAALEKAISEGRRFQAEARIVQPGGNVRDILSIADPVFDRTGKLTDYAGTIIDCTERRQAEEAGRRLAALVENSTDFIGFADLDGQVIFVNPAGRKLVGLDSAEDVRATLTTDYVVEEDRKLLLEASETAIETSNWKGEMRFRNFKTGAAISMVQHIFIVKDLDSGQIIGLATISRDVTEYNRSEFELHKVQAELAHVARATSMGELAASIAHEVNQPLSAVVLNVDACKRLLDLDSPPLDEIRQSLEDIADSGRRAAEVVSRIRANVTESRSERSRLQVNDVITEVLEFMRFDLANHRVSLHTELQKELPPVFGDRVELQQVLINLLSNGMEAMDDVGDRPRELWVTSSHSGTDVSVSVRDCGIGLDLDKSAKVFDTFYTTKEKGMGMGLPISRFIIQTHGGRIWASCAEPFGAIFQFALPSAAGEM